MLKRTAQLHLRRRVATLNSWIALAIAVCVAIPATVSNAADDVVAVSARTLHIGDGETIERAVVIIEDGKITAVGSRLPIPDGAVEVEVRRGSITPGLIDANAMVEPLDTISPNEGRERSALAVLLMHAGTPCPTIDEGFPCACNGEPLCALAAVHDDLEPEEICPICGQAGSPNAAELASGVVPGLSRTEATSEVVPHTYMIDTINFRSPDWQRLSKDGVTTVFVSSDSAAVIGPRGAIVKTAGPVRDRILQESADVQATMGTDSFRMGVGNSPPFRSFVSTRTRRPNSRMGVAWVFRKAFYDTMAEMNGQVPGGADVPLPEAREVLQQILGGDVPLRIQARTETDIATAIRVAQEFELPFTLLEATEAYKCADEIKAANVPVIFGPIYVDPNGPRARTGEARESRLSTIGELYEMGIEAAISAQDLRDEDGLARQAMYAIRAGLDLQTALRAVTQIPAQMLGIDDQVGTVEVGKQADIVVWSGEPFAAESQPVVVMVDGKIVSDRREKK